MSSTSEKPIDGDRNIGPALDGVVIATATLALLLVALRTIVRVRLVRWQLGWDDGAIMVAIVSFLMSFWSMQLY